MLGTNTGEEEIGMARQTSGISDGLAENVSDLLI
jgi:hypothetical protein